MSITLKPTPLDRLKNLFKRALSPQLPDAIAAIAVTSEADLPLEPPPELPPELPQVEPPMPESCPKLGRMQVGRRRPRHNVADFPSEKAHVALIRAERAIDYPAFMAFHGPSDSVRQSIIDRYLHGQGIEIGALHQPIPVPATAQVTYVDRLSASELRAQYSELANANLVEPDVLDDGETLSRFADDSQDFVIASHFLEHCQDPIGTMINLLRVLKPEGILYLALPDKRYTFDFQRHTTTIDHILRDYQEGPAWSHRYHFWEWAKYINLGYYQEHDSPDEPGSDPLVEAETDHLIAQNYSIHFHVWSQTEVLELLYTLQRMPEMPLFEVTLFQQNGLEMIIVLRRVSEFAPESVPKPR